MEVLATEWTLLKSQGCDVTQIETELYYLMLALERLDKAGQAAMVLLNFWFM